MQKICIRNNGTVKAFEMEIEKFNLLIGEQATGKSTIAKSVYFFRNIKTKVISYLSQVYDTSSYDNIPQESIRFDKAIKTELKDVFVTIIEQILKIAQNYPTSARMSSRDFPPRMD